MIGWRNDWMRWINKMNIKKRLKELERKTIIEPERQTLIIFDDRQYPLNADEDKANLVVRISGLGVDDI